MLRTIVIRNQTLSRGFKKALRSNVIRCMSTELVKKHNSNKLLSSVSKKVLTPQWTNQFRAYSSLPSHIKVNLPALSPTMESGSIVSWAKKEGDKLSEGDLLCEIETDKATMGFETPEEGYLAKILIQSGTKGVPVGKLLCIIVEKQEDVAAFKDFKDDSPAPAPAAAKGQGSGLYGSLKSGDLSDVAVGAAGGAPAPVGGVPAPAPAPGASFVDLPLSAMRETIAKRLSIAKQTIPHYQLTATVNVDKTLAMRKRINEKLAAEKSDAKVSVNDFIIKAVAASCKRVPSCNAHWMDSFIRQFSNVDVSVAVATPTGLITPIVFNADSRGIIDISRNVKELAAKAKEGRLQPQEYQGGTVTVSNLGMFGITMFNAIVNPPQSLILAVGGLQELVIPDKNEPQGFRTAKFISFTASADHRVIDGAVGAQWMKAFKEGMEDPANIIL